MFDALVPVVGAAAGAAAGVVAGAGGGVVRFSVDPDQAHKMIEGLKKAIERLMELETESGQIQTAGAPGPDPFSGYATLAMRKTAGTESGGYRWANREAQKALELTIKNIEQQLANYQKTDEAAQSAMKG